MLDSPDDFRPLSNAGIEKVDQIAGLLLDSELGVPRARVPDAHGPIEAGRCQSQAVRTERDAGNTKSMPLQVQRLLSTDSIPDLHRPVQTCAGRCQALAIRAEDHAV